MSATTQQKLDLSHFYGSDTLYKHWLGGMLYTEGVRYIANNASNGAYWLLDAIASHQPAARRDRMLREFQIWFLKPNGKGGARLECWRDTGAGQKPVIVQNIEYTDFPFSALSEEFKLYLENNTLCLPAER